MPNLQVSQERAIRLLNTVPHKRFQNAIEFHWKADETGHVAAQSVCWLFCWGKTGMGSEAAAAVARNVFDAILTIKFSELNRRITHKWARGARYDHNSAKIEMELNGFLR
jgi:hypothetical protein